MAEMRGYELGFLLWILQLISPGSLHFTAH